VTMMSVKTIGLCADYTHQGDWAFDFALVRAKRRNTALNIFRFPSLDCAAPASADAGTAAPVRWDDEWVALDRELREYYDERLGDYLEVGFRVCAGNKNVELRRCLMHQEYSVLVMADTGSNVPGCDLDIRSFAGRLCCPVVVVGPDRADRYALNGAADMLAGQLGLAPGTYEIICGASIDLAAEVPEASDGDAALAFISEGTAAFRLGVPESAAIDEVVRYNVTDPQAGVLLEDCQPIALATLVHLVGPCVAEAAYAGYHIRLHQREGRWALAFHRPDAE